MDIEYHFDVMATKMALMVLRQIRDWNTDAKIAAFSGDVEKQYKQLFKQFNDIILNSGLFAPGDPTPAQRNHWMQVLEKLEVKLQASERHLACGGDTGDLH